MKRTPTLSPDASPVAREVHRRATEQGFTQKGLAVASGVNETYVRDLYKGKSKNPKGDQIEKIARALGCTVDDLRRPGRPEGAHTPGEFIKDPDELALIGLWRALSDSLRGLALYQVNQLLPRPEVAQNDNR